MTSPSRRPSLFPKILIGCFLLIPLLVTFLAISLALPLLP
jgi:hypothetical protein